MRRDWTLRTKWCDSADICKRLRLHKTEVFGLREEKDISICVANSARIDQASRGDSAARWAGTLLSASMSKTRSESIHFLLGGPETFPHTQLPTNAEVIKRARLGPIYRNKTKSSFLHTVADEVRRMRTNDPCA